MVECEDKKLEMIANYSAFLRIGKNISEIQYSFSFGSESNHRAMVQSHSTFSKYITSTESRPGTVLTDRLAVELAKLA